VHDDRLGWFSAFKVAWLHQAFRVETADQIALVFRLNVPRH
jgi:hypothetical protein